MSYAETLLADGERVQYRARQHWLAPLSDARNAVLLFLASLVLFFLAYFVVHPSGTLWSLWGGLTFILFAVSVVWLARVYLAWSAQEYLVTNRRVIKVEGIVNKRTGDSSLDKINDATLYQGVLGRMLGYGDLEILTAAEIAVDRYQMLARAVAFKRAMLNAKHDLEQGNLRPQVPAPPLRANPPSVPTAQTGPDRPAAPSAGTGPGTATEVRRAVRDMAPDEVTQTLARLADLRDRGAITPEEYEAKKADLLARL